MTRPAKVDRAPFPVLTSTTGVGGTTPAPALGGLTDTDVDSPPTEGDTLRYVGGVDATWINDPRNWEAVTDGEDVFVWEGDDLVHEWNG